MSCDDRGKIASEFTPGVWNCSLEKGQVIKSPFIQSRDSDTAKDGPVKIQWL